MPIEGELADVIFGQTKAIPAIIALLREGPLNATQLQQAIRGYTGLGKDLGFDFAEAGLVTVEQVEGKAGKPSYIFTLTPAGTKVAEAAVAFNDAVEGAATNQKPPKQARR